jgi:PAS domain S-box-containing protein
MTHKSADFNSEDRKLYQPDQFFILESDAIILDHFNRKLLSITPNVFYLFDIKEDIYIFPNRGFEDFLGYPKGAFNPLVKSQLMDIMHPDDFTKYDWFVNEVKNAKEGIFLESQYRLKNQDGSWKWFMSKESVFMCDFENKPTHIFGVATDISKLKETERRILNSRAQLNAILNSTTDRIWSLDHSFKLIKFNAPFKNHLKLYYNTEAKKGISIFYSSTQEEIDLWTGYYNRSFKGERIHVKHSYSLNGKVTFFETIISPIIERDGSINSITCFSKDLLELRRNE